MFDLKEVRLLVLIRVQSKLILIFIDDFEGFKFLLQVW